MNTTSLSAVYYGQPGEMTLESIAVPSPRAGEILVRILGCTLCASDLHSYFGRRETPTPSILGHEIVAEIVAFGDESPGKDLRGEPLRAGDRIVWTLVASCGACPNCLDDLPQKCSRGIKYGHHAFEPGRKLLGGLAEYCMLLPGTGIVRLPEELTLAEACPAGCATATIAAALEAAGDLSGRSVGVIGAGMLGLTACAMAHSFGAAHVYCADVQPERRERALAFGATETVAPEAFVPEVLTATAGRGLDVTLEISGANAGFESCWQATRIGGRIVLVGSVFPAAAVPLSLEQMVRRNLTIRGVHNYAPRHLVAAVDFLLAQHQNYPFAELVGEWIPLSRTREAFDRASSPGMVRIGVSPGSG